MAHTPGPWTNDDGQVCGLDSRPRFAGTPSEDIFNANDWGTELYDEAMANAALIAAAPELLKLARLFWRSVEYEIRRSWEIGDTEGARLKTPTLNIIRAVIAKAEGG